MLNIISDARNINTLRACTVQQVELLFLVFL